MSETQTPSTENFENDELRPFLDTLADVLSAAKSSLHLSSNFLLSHCHPDTQTGVDLLNILKESRTRTTELRAIIGSLRSLADSYEQAVSNIEGQISAQAMHFGLVRLPNELLSLILAYAASTFEDACRLSQVCVRFRSVILSTPDIWADFDLTLRSSPDRISCITERSQSLPLRARIETVAYEPRCTLATTRILSLSNRLQRLYISPVNDRALDEYFDAAKFPFLVNLSMGWSKYIERQQNGAPSKHIYESWTMPMLQRMEANFVPRRIPHANILRCCLSFDRDSIYVSELLAFLGCSPSLKTLDLTFRGTSAWHEVGSDPCISLPSLDSLRLGVFKYTSSSLLKRITSRLTCQSLRAMSLTMEYEVGPCRVFTHSFATDIDAMDAAEDGEDFRVRSNEIGHFIWRHSKMRKFTISVEIAENNGDYGSATTCLSKSLKHLLSNLPDSAQADVFLPGISISWSSSSSCRLSSNGPTMAPDIRIDVADGRILEMLCKMKMDIIGYGPQPKQIKLAQHAQHLMKDVQASFPNSHILLKQ